MENDISEIEKSFESIIFHSKVTVFRNIFSDFRQFTLIKSIERKEKHGVKFTA